MIPIPPMDDALCEILDARTRSLVVGPELAALRHAVAREYGDSLAGILFYGSCLRSGDVRDGLVDLYVLVDGYRAAYGVSPLAFFNQLLPPNVFYLEVETPGGTVRAKYALLSMGDLLAGTTERWFHPYLWGRFAQPVAQLYARDRKAAAQMRRALLQAAFTLVDKALPVLQGRFTPKGLWEQALDLSYGTEMRPEGSARVVHLYDTYSDYYESLTPLLLAPMPVTRVDDGGGEADTLSAQISLPAQKAARVAWGTRRTLGRLLHVLRLVKALFTFRGGVDYALWKLERHTGVRIENADQVRRHPLIFGWGVMWRLRRRGVLR